MKIQLSRPVHVQQGQLYRRVQTTRIGALAGQWPQCGQSSGRAGDSPSGEVRMRSPCFPLCFGSSCKQDEDANDTDPEHAQ